MNKIILATGIALALIFFWVWNSEEVRTTGVMGGDGKTLTVKHEITEVGKTYELFMDGVLTKGSDF